MQLRTATEEDATRAATLLGDALSIASLPSADSGRLVLIRRLALGRISTHVSSATLALQIEEAARNVLTEAVGYDRPGAEEASVVTFPDRAEAIAALAGRHARRKRTTAWFWASLVSGWSEPATRAHRWGLLCEAAHSLVQAAHVAAAIVHEAIAAGVEDELLESITPSQAARWLQCEGWRAAGQQTTDAPFSLPQLSRWHVAARWHQRWTAEDPRLIWLCVMLALADNRARAADPGLPAGIARQLSAMATTREVGEARRPDTRDDSSRRAAPVDSLHPSARTVRESESSTAAPVGHHEPPTAASSLLTSQPAPDRGAEPTNAPVDDIEIEPGVMGAHVPQAFTIAAGLLFVVPILERLGFADWLVSNPDLLEHQYPQRLLADIAHHARVPAFDPINVLWSDVDDRSPAPGAIANRDLPSPARAILSDPPLPGSCAASTDAWIAAVRRWCRRNTRQGLLTLVRRPARLDISRTEVVVSFDLAQLDIRLRRVALDVDPGWVPWLGRIVTFVYVARSARW